MSYRVCAIQPGGGVATATPVPDTLEGATAYAARYGGEVISTALEAALRTAETPPAGVIVPRAVFKKRIAPAYLALAGMDDAMQRKWDRVLGGLLDDFVEVTLTDPTLKGLVQMAVADGLLSPQQAAAALAAG